MKAWQKNNELATCVKQLEQKVAENKANLEGDFYNALARVGRNVWQVVDYMMKTEGDNVHVDAIGALLGDIAGELHEMNEVFSAVLHTPYGAIRLKQVFEVLDDVIGEVDNYIEDFNELCENKLQSIGYIEEWDVEFFLDHM